MHRRTASLGGVLLSVLLASQAAAASWSPPFRIAAGAYPGDMAVLGGDDAAVVYEVPVAHRLFDLYVRRRVSSGGNTGVWAGTRLIASDADLFEGQPEIAGEGLNVDVVYMDTRRRVVYLRSTDGGYTFPHRVRFGPKDSCITDPLLARHGPYVVVAWDTWCEPHGTRVKVSTDGGSTFGPLRTLVMGLHGLAVTKTTIFVAGIHGGLVIRRSLDEGATWSRERFLATNVHGYYTDRGSGNMSAAGGRVYVTWVAKTDDEIPWVRYIRSLDSGNTWGPVRDLDLASRATGGSFYPIVDVSGKVARAVWARCDDGTCFNGTMDSVRYAQITDTETSPMELIVAGIPTAVGMADRPLVVYAGDCFGDGVCVKARNP